MKQNSLWTFSLVFLSFFIFCFSTLYASDFPYVPSGQESPEFLDALKQIQDRNNFSKGIKKIKDLSASGDYSSFAVLIQIIEPNDDFVEDTFRKLIENKNYYALVTYGRVLLDSETERKALKFLRKAQEFRSQYDSSTLEDLDYNFIIALCIHESPSSLALLREAWTIIRPYLNRSGENYKSLFIMLFCKIKMEKHSKSNQEELINEIGNFLIGQTSCQLALLMFTNTFYDTPHFERLLRKRNSATIIGQSGLFNKNAFEKAWQEKVRREKDFIDKAKEQVKEYALQELINILDEVPNLPSCYTKFNLSDISQLSESEKDTLSCYLIHDFNDRLFPLQNLDVKDFLTDIILQEGLYSRSQRQNFLKGEIFPEFFSALRISNVERLQSIIYNRLAILFRNDPSLSNQCAKELDKSSSENISNAVKIVMQHQNSDQLFAIPHDSKKQSLFFEYLNKLTERDKNDLVEISFRKMIYGE